MSTITVEKKTDHAARLNVRLSPAIKERIETAATISGMSVSDFAVSQLAAAADEILIRHNRITLDNVERDFFLNLLDSPEASLTPKALEAAARYNTWADAQRPGNDI